MKIKKKNNLDMKLYTQIKLIYFLLQNQTSWTYSYSAILLMLNPYPHSVFLLSL